MLIIKLKEASYVDNFSTSVLVLMFFYKVVYPADHFFSFFRFSKTFLKNIYKNNQKPKHPVCSPKGCLNASTALGQKLMPSAKR